MSDPSSSCSAVDPSPVVRRGDDPLPAGAGTLGDDSGVSATGRAASGHPSMRPRDLAYAMVLESRSMASSSLMSSANASSDTSTWRALTNIDFSPADRPLSL